MAETTHCTPVCPMRLCLSNCPPLPPFSPTVKARLPPNCCLQVVAEAANGPTTPEGDTVLRERGITVLPGEGGAGGGV